MRTGRSTSGAVTVPSIEGVPVALLKDELKPPRTAAQEKLAGLLARQAELANDISPAGEEKYLSVVAEIAKVQGEIAQQGAQS